LIRASQPENNMGDVILRLRRKAARGGERLIEKFCHWLARLTFTVSNLYIIPGFAYRKLMLLPAGASTSSVPVAAE